MGADLQKLLQSLCRDTEWNYAVFWKLKHRARMVLTWEDAYYNNRFENGPSESKSFTEKLERSHVGHFAHDPLGLAVAKMSYHVYSLGEGIVGQVAVTGKPKWIFAGEHVMNSCVSPELCDGWQAQFLAGIKTIVVVAVVPHGVVQLGSLNKVDEDLKWLTHIGDVFSAFQNSSTCHVPTPMQCSLPSVLQMSDITTRTLAPDVIQEYLLDLDKTIYEELKFASSPVITSPRKREDDSYGVSLPGVHLSEAFGLIGKTGLPEAIGDTTLLQSASKNRQFTDLLSDTKCGSNSCRVQIAGTSAGPLVSSSSQSSLTENSSLCSVKISAEKSRVQFKNFPVNNLESAALATAAFGGENQGQGKKLVALETLAIQNIENNMEIQQEISCVEDLGNLKSSFMFSSGGELHEALGPAFSKQCHTWPSDTENPDDKSASHVPEVMESSLLTSDFGSDNLLEAVVANFCRKDVTFKTVKSFSTSDSMLTTEKMPEPSISTSHMIGSSSYSLGCSSLLEESTQYCLNSSDSFRIRSLTSGCRELFEKPIELGKPGKKRARPGESSRPRPRDRQLIQDRIKELRELVPNGSKCSIDSLLERTIKHMVFLQSVTKHADKLSHCAKSRGCSKEIGALGSGYEQGSSWAVEVGGHMKICPIVVENLSINGQMLIEMLCEDCDHFLEIAEAIRSLGLTILKGITDDHGDKTWMRFVVEGQSNRNLHRMDVLWSLVQILQSKTNV